MNKERIDEYQKFYKDMILSLNNYTGSKDERK